MVASIRAAVLVGEALEPLGKGVVIATKFGFDLGPGGSGSLNSHPVRIKQVAEDSLKRPRVGASTSFSSTGSIPTSPSRM
jgi:aryl-alcohol dehydrogenase-like predicted oxidoreductase